MDSSLLAQVRWRAQERGVCLGGVLRWCRPSSPGLAERTPGKVGGHQVTKSKSICRGRVYVGEHRNMGARVS